MYQRSRTCAKVTATIAGLTVALAVAACGGSDASGGGSNAVKSGGARVDAAKKEGTVTWYTGLSPTQDEAAAAAFTKRYGIKVNILRLATGPLTQRFASEAQAGATQADVVLESDPTFAQQAYEKHWTTALTPAMLPALDSFPKNAVKPAYAKAVLLPWGIEYNSKLLAQHGISPPRTYQDLLNPRLRGQIILTDPRQSLGIAGNIDYIYNQLGADYLKKLGQQDLKVVDSLVPGLQQLAAGEGSVLLQIVPGADADLVKKGAPLKAVIPEATSGFAQYLSVAAKAPHPNAARLFANFLLTREGQQPLAAGAGVSPLGNLPGAYPLPKQFAEIDTARTKANLNKLVSLLGLGS